MATTTRSAAHATTDALMGARLGGSRGRSRRARRVRDGLARHSRHMLDDEVAIRCLGLRTAGHEDDEHCCCGGCCPEQVAREAVKARESAAAMRTPPAARAASPRTASTPSDAGRLPRRCVRRRVSERPVGELGGEKETDAEERSLHVQRSVIDAELHGVRRPEEDERDRDERAPAEHDRGDEREQRHDRKASADLDDRVARADEHRCRKRSRERHGTEPSLDAHEPDLAPECPHLLQCCVELDVPHPSERLRFRGSRRELGARRAPWPRCGTPGAPTRFDPARRSGSGRPR